MKRILLYVFMFIIGWIISGWVFKIKEIYFPYPIKPDTSLYWPQTWYNVTDSTQIN